MFSKLKFFLVVASLFVVAQLAYAATTSIVDTPFSSSYGTRKTTSPSIPGGGTSNDGNTSTYEGVSCGANFAANATACMAQLGVTDGILTEFEASCTTCDSGVNCICPSSYSESCSDPSSMGSGSACNGKYKQCVPLPISSCDTITPAINRNYLLAFTSASEVESLCRAKQGRSYGGSIICKDTQDSKDKVYCAPATCSSLGSQTYTATPTDSNVDNNFYGIQEGMCVDGNVLKYPWYCKAKYNYTVEPTCADQTARPLICSLEKTNKYACGFPLCANENMTVMNIVGNINPAASCPGVNNVQMGLPSLKCYLPQFNPNPIDILVCKCDEQKFMYNEEICRAEYDGDTAFKATAVYNISKSVFEYCQWESQTALDYTTGKGTAFAVNKIKYGDCLTTCPVGATLYNTPPGLGCSNGAMPTYCAQLNSGIYEKKLYCLNECPTDKNIELKESPTGLTCDTGSAITACSQVSDTSSDKVQRYFCLNKCSPDVVISDRPITNCSNGSVSNICSQKNSTGEYNEQKYYCACPKNPDGSDKYKLSCSNGQYLAGRQCTYDGGVVKYESCLSPCDASAGREVVGNPKSCSLSQVLGSGSATHTDPASGNYYCTIDMATVANCGADPTKVKCCTTNTGSASGSIEAINCVDTFTSINDTSTVGNMCIPGEMNQLCAKSNKASAAQWQCSCVGYSDPANCGAGLGGAGAICELDGKDKPKYERCDSICDSNKTNVATENQCNVNLSTPDLTVTNAISTPCYDDVDKTNKYECGCPTSWQTLDDFCADKGATCKTDYTGIGNLCKYDLKPSGSGTTPIPYEKYNAFMGKCSTNPNVMIKDTTGQCKTDGVDNSLSCSKNNKLSYYCACPESWLSLESFCTKNPSIDNCLTTYAGVGAACIYDVADINNPASQVVYKYKDYSAKCSDLRPFFDDPSLCHLKEGDVITSNKCYVSDVSGSAKYNCNCPTTAGKEYKLPEDCTLVVNGVKQVAAGIACNFDAYDIVKYEGCFNKCVNTTSTPVVGRPGDCPLVGGVQANTELCYNKGGDPLPGYACRCPVSLNYQTLDQYCNSFTCPTGDEGCQALSGGALISYCKNNYVGIGDICTYDVDTNGNSLDKYKSFLNACPTDRPLFYSKEECSTGNIKGGVFERYCNDRASGQERVLCKCPTAYQASCTGENVELGGQICNYEGQGNSKYENCFTKCENIPNTNGKGIEYLAEEDNDSISCLDMLGEGATWGANGTGSKCSRNHVLFNPCYCGSDYVNKCLNTDNELPEDGALACTMKGITYYNQCKNNECAEPSSTLAVISVAPNSDVAVACRRQFGDGAAGKNCGVNQAECSCNPREYTELCSYPETPPTGTDYCSYADSGLMSAGEKHYRLGACKVDPLMAPCGQHSLSNGTDFTPSGNPTVITATEGECRSRVGTGASTQLCEYSNGRRAYNCYYEAGKYKANEGNCPIRHILSGNYVIIGGVKNYEKCDCHPAYKFHKYNCAGLLSGGVCNQSTDGKNDDTIPSGISQMDYYPYCACPSDYNQVCDGVRNVGVGEVCDGKYKACECKPDPLPENWADNYYGCPGGKKPTGVIKQNGCGGKYYQCSVTECTWQHTEKCKGEFVEGVDACQDAQGNIGGYKSCRCKSGHDKICEDGTVGKGDPCIINGVYRYAECIGQGSCVRGENKTCQLELQVGVNPCTKNGVTYFEYCKCASGYDKLCENGEVGEGPACKLDGKDYYTKCLKPSATCTADHQEACDTNQDKYEPCVNKDNKLLYKCKCPVNWKTCAEGGAVGAETCTDSIRGTVYSQCLVQSTCSVEQNKTYKVCTSSQKGVGNSCIAIDGETTITKYADCEETNACKVNGYKFSCLGFDANGLGGDSCVDENGNKLYKECKCPSKWLTCPSKTNTKGQSCTPLLESGVSGEVVYESCGCDPSIYRYTCMKTETNLGIKPDNGKSCTPKIPGEAEPQDPLYSGCACETPYKNTCKGNGQIKNDNDYCERVPGGEKLYTYCECDPAVFTETCTRDSSNPGMTTPDGDSNKCIAIKADGSASAPLYKNCSCGRYYTQLCNGTNQIPPENDFCVSQEGGADVTKYSKCLCSEDFSQDCVPTGGNKGIYPPNVGEKDTCQAVNYVNDEIKRVNRYKECKCQDTYKYTCTAADNIANSTPALYAPDGNNYCQVSGENERKYTNCPCSSDYAECKPTPDNPQSEPIEGAVACNAILANGSTVAKYRPQDCQCKPQTPEAGYIKAVDNNMNSSVFLLQVKERCYHPNNFVIFKDGCGTNYFKCATDDPAYIYTTENCATSANPKWEVSGTTKFGVGDNGKSYTLYNQCDCPSSYNMSDCLKYTSAHPELYCTEAGDHRKQESCFRETPAGIVKLDDRTKCVKRDGTAFWQRCMCREIYDSAVAPGCMTRCSGDPSSAKDDQACHENGVFKITFNGGNAQNDSTCINPDRGGRC